MRREPKKTDRRDGQRVIDRYMELIREKWLAEEVDAMLIQAYLDDPESGAYSLGLICDAMGIEVIYFDEDDDERPR